MFFFTNALALLSMLNGFIEVDSLLYRGVIIPIYYMSKGLTTQYNAYDILDVCQKTGTER